MVCLDRFCPRLKLFAGFQISWKSVDELKLQLQADRKKYTVQRDTRGGDKCKVKDVLFPPQPRISFHGILNKTAWFPGVAGGRSHIWVIRVCLQPLAYLTLEKGIKSPSIYWKTKGYILLQFVF